MNFIRKATLEKGEKWGKKQINQAASMVTARMNLAKPPERNHDTQQPTDIQDILKRMGVRIE
jgi:hypothetical protein